MYVHTIQAESLVEHYCIKHVLFKGGKSCSKLNQPYWTSSATRPPPLSAPTPPSCLR